MVRSFAPIMLAGLVIMPSVRGCLAEEPAFETQAIEVPESPNEAVTLSEAVGNPELVPVHALVRGVRFERKNCRARQVVAARLINAAAALKVECPDCYLRVTGCARTVAEQTELIRHNCQNPPGSASCNPFPGKVATCMMRNGPQSCPHVSGLAIDVDLFVPGDKRPRIRLVVPDQHRSAALLERVMKTAGFTTVANEYWHWEIR